MKKTHINSSLVVIIFIIVIYSVFHIVGIGCPIKFLTGISCAGCGMTRAWFHVLQFDFQSAFFYHPLWALAPILIILILLRQKLNKKIFNASLTAIVLIFMVIYIIRLISPNDTVVIIDISQSAVIKLLKMLRRIIEL